MLNQIQTGKFISEIRKSKNMTQKELAEKLDISDKTVSKWETGKGMPDVSIMGSLCEILEINVNELLSGERLSTESYTGKAEENMMNLIEKSKEVNKIKEIFQKSGAVVGFLLMLVSFAWIMGSSVPDQGMSVLNWYIDFPSLTVIVGTVLLLLIISGTIGDLFRAFSICYGKKEYSMQAVRKSLNAVQFVMKGMLLSGIFASSVSLVATMGSTMRISEELASELSLLFYMIGISILPFLYCVILNIFLLPLESKLKNMMIT